MLQNRSMLVDLTIHRWTATKHDRSVSAQVEQSHGAKDAGRYNKQLIDKAHLAEVDTLGNEIRKYHYTRTLPWTDKGARLLPSDLFDDYRQGLAALKQKRQAAVSAFLTKYPQLVQDARLRLNTMFQPEDYPTGDDLKTAFDIDIEIMPVPDAEDFRVSLGQEAQAEIRQQITETIHARQAKAVEDCYKRVREVVARIAEQCGKDNGRIHDSLIENAHELVAVLHGLNITGDAGLTKLEADVRQNLLVSADVIRASSITRKRVARAAEDILRSMP